MRKHIFRNRKARYASITAALTILVLTVTILANTVFGTLAKRYEWYTVMLPEPNYDVSDNCYAMLDELFTTLSSQGKNTHTKIIFCDREDGVRSEQGLTYVLETARALEARFPEHISVHCYDSRTNPSYVKQYATKVDPVTGETVEVSIAKTSVIVASDEGYHRVYSRDDFFLIRSTESNFWAYNGDKIMASAILHAIDPEKPVAYLTMNHGEIFANYEIVYVLDDAGYTIKQLDLYKESIPDDCDLIVSYNPQSDLVADDLSAVSEIDKLEQFLSRDGASFLTFIGNNSPSLPNFEAFLSNWGIGFSHHNVGDRSYRYMVGDSSASLTSDGYTIYGEAATEGEAATMVKGLESAVVFQNATALRNTGAFLSNGDGSYRSGNRTMYALYTGGESALSWANGSVVAEADEAILMSLTEQTLASGTSHVGVVASTDFASETMLQSVVYGNSHVLHRVFECCGKDFTTEGITAKPHTSGGISIITTRQMLVWTIVLATIPALAASISCAVILIRRRRA